jgi:rod shape-determining protein MreD
MMPILFCTLLVLLETISLSVPGNRTVTPALGLAGVIYWSANRRHMLPVWWLLPLGLMQDALGGSILGLHTLALLWASYRMQRAIAAGCPWHVMRAVGWTTFALAQATVMIADHLLRPEERLPLSLVWQYGLSLALFPVLWRLQDSIYQRRIRFKAETQRHV